MAALGQTFDATTIAPNAPREIIPPGKYLGQIVHSEMRQTKDGTGQYLYMEIEILDGEYAGRRIFERLNLVNNNQQAVDIANRTLSSICHATGTLQVRDSEQLHHKNMLVTVKVRPASADGKYGASNEVGGYAPANGSAPVAFAAPASAPAAKPAAASAPPWKRTA